MIKLAYCCKKTGSLSSCAEVATYKVKLRTKKNDKETANTRNEFRCDRHKQSSTAGMSVIESEAFDQSENLGLVNRFLNDLVGKDVFSKFHRNEYSFIGKYLKPNGGIMCQNEHTKKWKFVYYKQLVTK